jgi:hypothetical protein
MADRMKPNLYGEGRFFDRKIPRSAGQRGGRRIWLRSTLEG